MPPGLSGDRTFPNDPNPPASAMVPEAPKVSPPQTPESSAGTGALPPQKTGDGVPPSSPVEGNSKQSFTIGKDEDGKYQIDAKTPNAPWGERFGTATLSGDDLEHILKDSGAHYDSELKTYENVPEDVVKTAMSGRPSMLDAIKRNFGVGEADLVRGAAFESVVMRKRTVPEAMEMSNPERVEALAKSAWSPWHGLGDFVAKLQAHPVDTAEDVLKYSVGKAASFLPSVGEVVKANMIGRVVGGSVGALAGPEAIPIGMELGGAAASFLSLYHMGLGQGAAHLADQGYTTEQIRKSGPELAVSSAVSSALWMWGIDAMASPFAKTAFFQGLAKSPEAQKVMANWAYTYGMNAGVKMPALGAVQSLVGDFTNNLVAQVNDRPDLLLSTKDMSKNMVHGALDMAAGSAVLGVPGAAAEAITGRQSAAAEARLSEKVTKQLEGVERREPTIQSSQPTDRAPVKGGSPSSQIGEKGASAPSVGTPPSQIPNSEAVEPWRKNALPDSVTDHPAFVKAQEDATPHLPEGVGAKDRGGVVDAYVKAADEAHKFEGRYKTMVAAEKEGTSIWTPEQQAVTQAEWTDAMRRMMGLKDLATFYRDPNGQLEYKEWIAGGQEGAQPDAPIDPYSEQRGDYKYGLRESSAAQKLDMMLTGKNGEATSEQIMGGLDEALNEQSFRDKRQAGSLEQKTRDVEAQGRMDALHTELDAIDQKIGELASVRDRMQKHGLTTGVIDRQLDSLFQSKGDAAAELAFLTDKGKAAAVEPDTKLELKPATLQDIVKIGFKEGSKQSQTRARELATIAKENGLTPNDVKKLVGNRMLGAMGDLQYKNFLEGEELAPGTKTTGFREGVAKLVEKKAARTELAKALKDRDIEHEQYVRQINNLPPFSKMTTEQLRQYTDIVRGYEKGDVALSPKRIAELEGTDLAGAKTERAVREQWAKLSGQPVEDLKNVKVGLLKWISPDPQLRQERPELAPLIDYIGEHQLRGKELGERVVEQHEALAAAALKEMRPAQGIGERIANWWAPKQRAVRAYLEARTPEEVEARGSVLGPATLKWAQYMRAQFKAINNYLEKDGMVSRFIGAYAPHMERGWREILRDSNKVGLGQSLTDMFPQASQLFKDFTGSGDGLGLSKFFKHSQFRTGELTPSDNMIRAGSTYFRDFYNKAALDRALPVIDTAVRAMESKDPLTQKRTISSLRNFTNDFLENKKGNNEAFGPAGRLVTPTVRAIETAASIHWIGANYALQAVKAGVGIPLMDYLAIRNPEGSYGWGAVGADLARAEKLRWTEQGKAIVKKYGFLIPDNPFEQLSRPSADIGDYAQTALYGGFSLGHSASMQRILLGSLTSEELKSGEVSTERINQIMQAAGRWVPIHGQESIIGANPVSGLWKQMKSWTLPPVITVKNDAIVLMRSIATGGKERLTDEQMHDILRLGVTGVIAVGAKSLLSPEMEDDTFSGRLIHYLRSVSGGIWRTSKPDYWLSAPGLAYGAKVAVHLYQWASMEEYKSGEHEGENKGAAGLKRDLTPALWKQIQSLTKDE